MSGIIITERRYGTMDIIKALIDLSTATISLATAIIAWKTVNKR